jgi:hypothetical protein
MADDLARLSGIEKRERDEVGSTSPSVLLEGRGSSSEGCATPTTFTSTSFRDSGRSTFMHIRILT